MPRKKKGSEGFTVVSTFSGCGGSSLGYKNAGGRVLLAVEWEKNAVETYKLNFPGTPVYHGDISKLTAKEVLVTVGLAKGELDLFDGSPPCQGFSSMGKRNMADGRNQLFKEYVRLLRGLQPRAFIMENVAGMVKGNMKFVFVQIIKELKASGYCVKAKCLNAMYYGVPQSRSRMIFIGVRKDLGLEPSFPEPSTQIVSCRQALEGLVYDEAEREYLLQVGREKESYKYWDIIPLGKNLSFVLKRNFGYSMYRVHPDKPCNTITKSQANIGMFGLRHWAERRSFTVGEYKRFTTFPDEFKFAGSYTNAVERIGNSVPPMFMEAIASHVHDTILNPSPRSTGKR
jgi:DNA (cytosine-5)-methyltransferase 1